MIVLKETQDKILKVLQSVAGIVERRHTLPALANVLLCNTDSVAAFEPNKTARAAAQFFRPASLQLQTGAAYGHMAIFLKACRQGFLSVSRGLVGFFSSSKTNLRNAP